MIVQPQDNKTNPPIQLSAGTGGGTNVVMPADGLTMDTQALSLALLPRQTIAALPNELALSLAPADMSVSTSGGYTLTMDNDDISLEICT